MDLRYPNLTELKAAYDSRSLPGDAVLILGNDSATVHHNGETVYEGDGPAVMLREALELLGIPHATA